LFIFDPLVDPVAASFRQLLLSDGGTSKYAGYFDAYSVAMAMVNNVSAHSGLTAKYLVNGNSNPTPTAARAALEQNKFNSYFLKDYNLADVWDFFDYGGSGALNDNIQLRAIAMWTVSLTDAEMAMAHNSYPQMATWDG